jgi:Universal stress protein UspA and related nucleotide-binding proteins
VRYRLTGMTYRHLLVPTDGTELSDRAIDQAVELAAALGARLRFLHVQVSFPISLVGVGELVEPSTVDALVAASQQRAETILTAAIAKAQQAGVMADRSLQVNPQPHQAILQEAQAHDCDLIVMASHGRRGLEGLLIGSETQRVLTQGSYPVLVVR